MIPSMRHEIWGWPAAVNVILGGTAGGFFLFSFLNTELCLQAKAAFPLFRYNIVSPFLVAAGFLTVGIEAGSPLRGIFLLHHLKKSWMSREVLIGLMFILFGLLDWIYPSAAIKFLGAAAAAGLLVCQGFMVFRARAVTAWNNYLIPYSFVASGLAMGFGFSLFWSSALTHTIISTPILLFGLISLISNLVVWFIFVKPQSGPIEDRALIHLRDPLSMTLTLGFGHIVPILSVLAIIILAKIGSTDSTILVLFIFTGICILTGGVIQKIALILQANALHAVKSGQPQYHMPLCP